MINPQQPMPTQPMNQFMNPMMGGQMPQSPEKKNNTTVILIVCIIIAAVVAIVLYFVLGTGGTKGVTLLDGYSKSDVKYSCVFKEEEDDRKVLGYADIVANKDNYGIQIYEQMDISKKGFTDNDYFYFLSDLDSSKFSDSSKKYEDSYDLGKTNYGWNTKVKRTTDGMQIAFIERYGLNEKATESDVLEYKKAIEKNGFECK